MTAAGLIYLLPIIVSLAICFAVAAYCWRRRHDKGALLYSVVAASQGLWTAGFLCETISSTLAAKVFWDDFQYIGAAGWGIGFLYFTFNFIDGWSPRRHLFAQIAAVLYIIIIPMAYTNPWHGLMRANEVLKPGEPFSALVYDFPPCIYVYCLASYSGFIACLWILCHRLIRAKGVFRRQLLPVIVGNALPLMGTIVTLTGLLPPEIRDITPYTFAVGNLIVAWGLFRGQLFDIMPLAWDRVVENMKEAVIVVDPHNRVVGLNPAAVRLADRGEEELIGAPAADVFPLLPDSMSQPTGEGAGRAEITRTNADGTQYLEIRSQPLLGPHGRVKGRALICADVTSQRRAAEELERHRERLRMLVDEKSAELVHVNRELEQHMTERQGLELQLHHAQKMEAIGRLAGGIAHDFNNLLMPIMTITDIMLTQLPQGSTLWEDVMQIRQASTQGKNLIAQILAISRRQVLQMRALDLNAIVAEFQNTVGRLVESHIQLETRLAADGVKPVMADRGQIEQVLMNLVVNARDAMPDGGQLVITTANQMPDDWQPTDGEDDRKTDDYVMVAIRDTGEGMSEEVIEHIFEPFFTTKPVGEGTGLGMATVFGIVKQHGGFIRVRSAVGSGTEVRFWLPASAAGAEATPSVRPKPAGDLQRGSETIFVVEDEAKVRETVCRALRLHGYTVLESESPEAALQLAQEYPDTIDLLLADVVMPGMNGRELYEQIQQIRPTIKRIYMSGYTNDVVLDQGVSEGESNFIQKPFSLRVLTGTVRRILDT